MGNLSTIAQFADPEETYCAKGFLHARGIDCIIQNDHHLTMAPSLRVALGGYRLMVIRSFADDAKAALDEVAASNSDDGAAQQTQEGDDSGEQYKKAKNWLWLPIAFAHGVPFLPAKKRGPVGVFQFLIMASIYTTVILTWFFGFADR